MNATKSVTPKRVQQNTPSKTGLSAQKNSLGRKSGFAAAAASLADEPMVFSDPRGGQSTTALTNSNGTGTIVATDDGWLGAGGVENGDAFWDGEDMSLEMVTDINDGDVDEEVRFSFSSPLTLTQTHLLLSSDGILTNLHPISSHP